MTYNVYCECGSSRTYRNRHKARDDGWRNLLCVSATAGADDTQCTGLCPSCAERTPKEDLNLAQNTRREPDAFREPGADSSLLAMHQ